jgi:hypothetical protein
MSLDRGASGTGGEVVGALLSRISDLQTKGAMSRRVAMKGTALSERKTPEDTQHRPPA